MYAYVSKKIALFKEGSICCAAWNKVEGWISIGGCDGLLKVIKLDPVVMAEYGIEDTSTLTDPLIHQTLEGHTGTIVGLVWNEPFQKLVSTDEHGLTIVWGFQDDIWCQEMMNSRNVSYVTDMKWTSDGRLICITYEDGTVTVGSVEGNKVWGLELGVSLRHVEWSPNYRNVIFISKGNHIQIYDQVGNYVKDVQCGNMEEINHIHWHGTCHQRKRKSPSLAIMSMTGQICLTRNIGNTNDLMVNSDLKDGICQWNPNGRILAACGRKVSTEKEFKNSLVLRFYDKDGRHLHEMVLSDDETLIHLEWEVSGSKIHVTTERDIYLVSVQQSHLWTTINSNSTLVYQSFETEKINFLSTIHNEKVERSFGDVKAIQGDKDYCVIITSNSENPSEMISNSYSLVFCDEVGTVWSKKKIRMRPDHVSMNGRLIVVSDHRNVYLYIFDSLNQNLYSSSNSSLSRFSNGMERMFDVHDTSIHPSKANVIYNINDDTSDPSITALCATSNFCMIGLEDNYILLYSLPNITRLNKIRVECDIPKVIKMNCNLTKFSVIDSLHNLQIFDLEKRSISNIGVKSYLEPSHIHNAWAMEWSREDPDTITVLDQSRLLEINLSVQAEIHVVLSQCDGYIVGFSNFEIYLAFFDEIISRPNEIPNRCTIDVPSKTLEDMRNALTTEMNNKKILLSSFSELSQKQLWEIWGSQALENLDFAAAEKAFTLSENYAGLLFIERLSLIKDQDLQQAEVLRFIGRSHDAEKKYLNLNRPDLAIQMNIDRGEWSRVTPLLTRDGLSNSVYKETWSTMADRAANQNRYRDAAEYYENAGNIKGAIECLLLCQDYESIKRRVDEITPQWPHLEYITKRLLSNGKHELAVECQKKVDTKLAMDTYVSLNKWEEASSLAESDGLRSLLHKHALTRYQELLQDNQPLLAFHLCQCVGLSSDAAIILSDLVVKNTTKENIISHSIAKKIFILAAKQAKRHREKKIDMSQLNLHGGKKDTSDIISSIEKLMDSNSDKPEKLKNSIEILKHPWRNTAAHHYFLMAHAYFYNNKMENAMKVAILCSNFVEILNPLKVYSLIALTSYLSGYLEVCSTALTKFKEIDGIDKLTTSSIETLEFGIFTEHKPVNKVHLPLFYVQCIETTKSFNACTITGKNITNQRALLCRICRFYMLEEEARGRNSCALCHSDCQNAEAVTILD